jgi:hypothetical protein
MKEMLLRLGGISRFINKTPAPLCNIPVDPKNADIGYGYA